MGRPNLSIALTAALVCVAGLTFPGCGNLSRWMHNGFKVGPNYTEPPAPISPEWIDQTHASVIVAPGQDCGWWTVFNDPALNALVEAA